MQLCVDAWKKHARDALVSVYCWLSSCSFGDILADTATQEPKLSRELLRASAHGMD